MSPAEVLAQMTTAMLPQIRRWAGYVTGQPFTTRIVNGKAADQILRYLREEPVDLLVMGTHGRRGFMRFIMGSVAENVMKYANCSVLVARSSAARMSVPLAVTIAL